jgi:pimeloyl-ACP methyl ester carboxylesterase
VHPQLSFVEDMRIEFRQTLALHERLFADCEAQLLPCPAEPRRLFEEMIEAASALGIDQQVLQVWRDALADAAYRQVIPVILNLQATELDPQWLYDVAELADSSGVAYVVNFSVNCTDASTEPASVQELDALYAEFTTESPYFASLAMAAAACTGWPATRDPVPLPVATEAPPLLVIGGVADLRTPFAYAEAMTDALGNATLLTSNHYGHGATPLGNECVNQAVRGFLIDGALPQYGAECF